MRHELEVAKCFQQALRASTMRCNVRERNSTSLAGVASSYSYKSVEAFPGMLHTQRLCHWSPSCHLELHCVRIKPHIRFWSYSTQCGSLRILYPFSFSAHVTYVITKKTKRMEKDAGGLETAGFRSVPLLVLDQSISSFTKPVLSGPIYLLHDPNSGLHPFPQ